MNPTSLHPLQSLMEDIQVRQKKLGEQMLLFQTLQQEISELRTKAPQSPLARQRLERLTQVMEGELAPVRLRLSECMNSLQSNFVSLESSLKNAGQVPAEKPAVTEKKAPFLGRQFI